MTKHVFCTDLCLERGEPLAGTGSAPERVMLLAWPRGKWRSPRWDSEGVGPELRQMIKEAADKGVYVVFVDKVEAETPLPMLRACDENLIADFPDQSALVAAIADYVEGKVFEGVRDDRLTLICCTDSRRDACCARYGFATYKALVALADPTRYNIVQSAHIGGCRFAGSMMVLPMGQRYGRMRPEHAQGLLDSLAQDEVYLPRYKGNALLNEAEQVAEIAALNWATEHGFGQSTVTFLSAAPEGGEDGESASISLQIGNARLQVNLIRRSFFMQGNCAKIADDSGEDTLRWCLVSATEDTASLASDEA